MTEGQIIRNNIGVAKAGDVIAAGQLLIIAGAKTGDGRVIKAGIERLKSVGFPNQLIIVLARHLVKEAKK